MAVAEKVEAEIPELGAYIACVETRGGDPVVEELADGLAEASSEVEEGCWWGGRRGG